MSAKAISEFDAKRLVSEHIQFDALENKFLAVQVNPSANFDGLLKNNAWIQSQVRVQKHSNFYIMCLSRPAWWPSQIS